MNTADYILKKFDVTVGRRMPVWLPISRDRLIPLFVELGYKVGAEIGVARGKFSEKICRAGLRLYAIDAYTAYEGYDWHTRQRYFDKLFEEARDKLAPYDHQLIRCFSMDALKLFPDDSLDFVYIDANHDHEHVIQDIAGWSRKVRPGGIISGHDYARYRAELQIHVKDAVLGWTYSHRIKPWFVTRHRPSWLWVKGNG